LAWDQALPKDSFVQFHAGFERPSNLEIEKNSVYWRTALAQAWRSAGAACGSHGGSARRQELDTDAKAEWDLVPQMQVTLSVFQHIRASVGVRRAGK
jgi:hypothetical protein